MRRSTAGDWMKISSKPLAVTLGSLCVSCADEEGDGVKKS